MLDYDLIPASAYDNIEDEEPEQQFATLAGVAQGNVAKLLESAKTADQTDFVRRQYMTQVIALAEALDIRGLPSEAKNVLFKDFQANLAAVLTKIRVIRLKGSFTTSVAMGPVGKAHIRLEIERLRAIVVESGLEDKQKQNLIGKLDDILADLDKRRLSFAKVAAVAATVAAIFGGTSSGLANAPKALGAVQEILYWIGSEKVAEDNEQLRLTAPPLALPAPTSDASGTV